MECVAPSVGVAPCMVAIKDSITAGNLTGWPAQWSPAVNAPSKCIRSFACHSVPYSFRVVFNQSPFKNNKRNQYYRSVRGPLPVNKFGLFPKAPNCRAPAGLCWPIVRVSLSWAMICSERQTLGTSRCATHWDFFPSKIVHLGVCRIMEEQMGKQLQGALKN